VGRMGSVDDIGQAAVFLASPLASYVSGCVLVCDGGANLAGSGCHDERDGGLTSLGRSIVQEMDRVGLVKCCSHTGYRTAMDIFEMSTRPTIFSHSNPRALRDHPRNVPDDLIDACARSGGVVCINGVGIFLGDNDISVTTFVDHVDYVAKLVGVEHVAIGSDLDVVGNPNAVNGGGFDPRTQPNFSRYQYHEDGDGAINIRGLNHAKRVFDLAEGLIRRGYTDAQIAQILGGNAIRVLGAIWPA